jgi:hypothetical protein
MCVRVCVCVKSFKYGRLMELIKCVNQISGILLPGQQNQASKIIPVACNPGYNAV